MRVKGLCASILSWGLLVLAAPAGAANLVYLGGPVVRSAKAVDIFWGPSFANPASPDYFYAQRLILFRNQFGTNPEYNIITQYYQIVGGVKQHIQLSNLAAGTPDWFDTSTPPTNVTDADAQAEVRRYLATHAFDASTIYEIFLPSTSYSSFGGGTSCGGPQLAFCAYHNFTSGTTSALYTVQPYASCSACQVAGWTADQNQERNVAYATRSTVVNPHFNSWYDPSGNTGDDLCGWTPPPFLDGGFGYPYDWSNAAHGCVRTR
ncbi:MAG TPA: hypothetical protein VOA87_09895 [Thermoanaerobaculia bacterium]|nr:hypothetical protein [Thermoanaerobaculia bacterium]